LNHAPDQAETALLLIDVINPIDFKGGEKLPAHALPMAHSLAAFKRHTKAAGVPVIYVNDNFRRWRSDCRKLVEHCLNAHVRGKPVIAQLRFRR
jgi:nicotinamidase-related amidase